MEQLNQFQLKAIYKACMMVIRQYELSDQLPEKYHNLLDDILNFEEIEVHDMMDNMEYLYKLIDQSKYKEE